MRAANLLRRASQRMLPVIPPWLFETFRTTHPYAPTMGTELGRSITELAIYGGRLYGGYGDTFENTGSVRVDYFDLFTQAWVNGPLVSTERVGAIRRLGVGVYATHDDPISGIAPAYSRLRGGPVGNILMEANITNLLSPNASSVETDTLPWEPGLADVTVELSDVWASDGLKSVKFVRVNTLGQMRVRLAASERVPCTPGVLYGALVTLKPPFTVTCFVDMLFYDAAGALISTSPGPGLSATATGTQVYGNGIAPDGSVTVGFQYGLGAANAGVGTEVYADKFQITRYSFQTWTLGGTSTKANWLPVHIYDLVEDPSGAWYTVGNIGVMGGAAVLRSIDQGATWADVLYIQGSPKRFYSLGMLGSDLYTVIGDTDLTGPVEKYIIDLLEPGYRINGTTVSRTPVLTGLLEPINFDGTMYYRGEDDVLRSYDGVNLVKTVRPAKLHCRTASKLWAIDGIDLFGSEDGETWSLEGEAPPNATSMVGAPSEPLGGVCTHLTYTNTIYEDGALVASKLQSIKATMARDEWPAPGQSESWMTRYYSRLTAANEVGVKFVMIPCNPGMDIDFALNQMEPYAYLLAAIEGPNEWNNNSGENWASELTAHVEALWTKVRSRPAFDGIPVVGPALKDVDNFGSFLPSYSNWVDIGNLHYYHGSTFSNTDMLENIIAANKLYGGKELWMTEIGAHFGDGITGTEEDQAARYKKLMSLVGASEVTRAFYYELLNGSAPNDPSTHYNNNFGCFRTDGSEKPVASEVRDANRRTVKSNRDSEHVYVGTSDSAVVKLSLPG